MDCADLERYLEAHLDGQLAAGRARVLKRHLACCERCRHKLERLQAFERQLQRRFRGMRTAAPVWSALEVDLVGEGNGRGIPALPPPPGLQALPHLRRHRVRAGMALPGSAGLQRPSRGRSRSSILSRVIGIAILAAAVAAVLELAADMFPVTETSAVGSNHSDYPTDSAAWPSRPSLPRVPAPAVP